MFWRLRRLYLAPVLRLRTDVVQVDLGAARVYCAGCLTDELDRVREVKPALLSAAAAQIARYLSVNGPTPMVRFLCFGSAVELARLPGWLRSIIRENKEACWVPELWAVVLNLRGIGESAERLRVAVIHELAHALMTALARAYVYPRAIHEAFAVSIQHDFGYEPPNPGSKPEPRTSSDCPWGSRWLKVPPTIRDLLTETSPTGDGTFHRGSLALLAFLASLNRSRGGVLDNWLAEVRRLRLNGKGIYVWLQRKLNWDEDTLEAAFARFLMSGDIRSV